jgi:RimJ/RimL family protein N-acetyltransferase
MRFLFFRKHLCPPASAPALPPGLTLEFWRPGRGRLRPPGVPATPFLVWGLFHLLRVFTSRDYAMVLIFERGTLVHRTCLLPAHYRFPFMAAGDLQAAGIWTHPDKRGTGLGLAALQEVARRHQVGGRVLWYMVREDNLASIRLAEKGGFHFWGNGLKTAMLGIGLLGSFQITGGPNLHLVAQPGRIRQQLCRPAAGRRSQRPSPGPGAAEGP